MLRNRLLLAVILLPAGILAADSTRLPPKTFVAKRGAGNITLADVDAAVGEMPPDVRRGFFNNRNRIEATLSKLLLIEQLASEAKQSGLDQDVQIQAQMRLVSDRVLATARLQQLGDQAPKSDVTALTREAYQADPSRFNEPDHLIARHVLIKSGTGTRDEAAARTLAEKVRDEALAGKRFEQLATQYSEDEGTKANGGLLPEFGPGQMQKSFEEAAYKLAKPGAISPVVPTSYGFHVIVLVERKPGKKHTFDEIKTQLAQKLEADQLERYKKDHADQLQSMAIDTNADAIESLMTRYAGADGQSADAGKSVAPAPAAAAEPKH